MKNENKAKERIGEESISTNGQKMKIIAYRNTSDIDVQFEDGNVVKHKSYSHFKEGKITQLSLQKDKRLGETKIMNCGKSATITEYFSAHNITIQFEDGTILKKKYYKDFSDGKIKHPDLTTNDYRIKIPTHDELSKWSKMGSEAFKKKHEKIHLHETHIAKNGQKMTITRYNGWDDIDVVFDDGTVVTNQRYEKFKKGEIVNPNNKIVSSTSINEYIMLFYLSKLGFKKAHQGELKHLGLGRLEIDCFYEPLKIGVEYDGNVHGFRLNTDVRKDKLCKENGITLFRIREKLKKSSKNAKCYLLSNERPFSKEYEKILQKVCNDLVKNYSFAPVKVNFEKDKDEIMNNFESEYIITHLGEEFTNKKGEHCVITRYISHSEVYIKFDDGYERKCNYSQLKKDNFEKRAHCLNPKERISEEKVMNCGMKAKIIAYRKSDDIDVKLENGIIIEHKSYESFRRGQISLKAEEIAKRLGETRTMNCGKKATIIAYNDSHNIDVQFEDGTIVKHKSYGSFQTGKIAIPANNKESRTGETKIMNFGMKATIINYNNNKDIDIQFEDGTIVKHRSYLHFKEGSIGHPNYKNKKYIPD